MKLKTPKNNLKESSSGPFIDWETNKKARKEVLDWWADVEEWNAANGYPYNIENDTDDVSGMFTAIFDMARDLRKDAPELYKRGKAINNRYGLSQIKESADIEYNPKDRAEAALMDLKLNVSKLGSILRKSKNTYNSDLDDESKMNKLADRVGILNNYIQQALDELGDDTNESLTEDTVKQNKKWVNKGKEGTHGKFRTKKEADAQRRAIWVNWDK